LAILGFCLGALGAFFSFAVFLGMLLQQPYLNHRPMQFGGQRQNPWQMQDTFEPPPLPDGPVAKFSSNLPIITVDTAGQAVFKDGSIPVRTAFFEVTNGRASLNAAPAFESAATIHTRGYTTLRLPKKSYTLHLPG
jgi:hypothetical protein